MQKNFEILCAAELEFIPQELEKLPPEIKNFQSKQKKLFLQKLEGDSRTEQLKNFLPEEVMMFDLHEVCEQTKNKLEFIFGTGRGDNSYYDAVIGIMRCMEIKMTPVPIQEFDETLSEILTILNSKAAQYGIKITEPKIQLNISFWKDSKNVFDPENEEFKTTAPKLISGILNGIYENRKELQFLYVSATGAPPLISLKVGREGFSRLVGEGEQARLELRLSRAGATVSQIDIPKLLDVVEEGALIGLGKKPTLSKVKRCVFKRSGDELKITTHVLLGSRVKKNFLGGNFKLLIPENYISGWLYLNFAKIALELGFEPISPTINTNELKFLHKEMYDALANEYIAGEQQRIEYLKQLKAKQKRNRLEELEYNFLTSCYKKQGGQEKMQWPAIEKLHEHFAAQKEASVLLEEILEFFRTIKLSRDLKIIIKPKAKFARAAEEIKNKITAEKIVDSFIMKETLEIN